MTTSTAREIVQWGMKARWSRGLPVPVVPLALAVLLLAGCSASTPTAATPPTDRAPAASSRSTAAPATVPPATRPAAVCDGETESNQDDEGAVDTLVTPTQLPAGDWQEAPPHPCPWALSVDELLAKAVCRDAATAAGAPPNDEARNGNGHVTYARADGVRLDHRMEIYTSRQNVDALRAILAGPGAAGCYEAAVRQRVVDDADVDEIEGPVTVRRFAVQPGAAALGLGFPASDGYAADSGFVEGADLTFRARSGAATRPVALRVVSFGSGGFVSTLTLIGESPEQIDAVPLEDSLRAAAQNYRTELGLP